MSHNTQRIIDALNGAPFYQPGLPRHRTLIDNPPNNSLGPRLDDVLERHPLWGERLTAILEAPVDRTLSRFGQNVVDFHAQKSCSPRSWLLRKKVPDGVLRRTS